MTDPTHNHADVIVDDKLVQVPTTLIPATEAIVAALEPAMTDAEKLAYALKLHEGKCKGAWVWENGEWTDRVRCPTCAREWVPSRNPNLAGRPQPRKEQAE